MPEETLRGAMIAHHAADSQRARVACVVRSGSMGSCRSLRILGGPIILAIPSGE